MKKLQNKDYGDMAFGSIWDSAVNPLNLFIMPTKIFVRFL